MPGMDEKDVERAKTYNENPDKPVTETDAEYRQAMEGKAPEGEPESGIRQ